MVENGFIQEVPLLSRIKLLPDMSVRLVQDYKVIPMACPVMVVWMMMPLFPSVTIRPWQ
jgi:hypothetical protein